MSADPRDRPLHELVRELAEGTTRLVRNEIALAKLEARKSAERMAGGAAAFAVAALLAVTAGALLVATIVLALDLVLPAWAATLVVAGLFLLLAAIAAAIGRALVRRRGPGLSEQVRESAREDLAALRGGVSNAEGSEG